MTCAAVFPPDGGYGTAVFGAAVRSGAELIGSARLLPPVSTPRRLERLIDLAREPTHQDVVLDTVVGGFRSPLPVYLSAFGSTRVSLARRWVKPPPARDVRDARR